MTKLVHLRRIKWEVPPVPAADIGRPGRLEWIPIDKLLVDESYQRPIEYSGKKNIRKIVEEFHWTKFGPLIVSPRPGLGYAIIDGQHHAVAALCHGGIQKCPCWVLDCTEQEEARAFHTINGIVTRVQTQYLFRARLASGDPSAVAADEAARAAGAKIMPYPAQSHQLKDGETLACKTIEQSLAKYGREVVVMALELIVKTGENAGFVKADLIEGFCDALYKHPAWLKQRDEALAAVKAVGARSIFREAMAAWGKGGGTIRIQVSTLLSKVLADGVGDGRRAAVPAKTLTVQAREQAKKDHVAATPKAAEARPQEPAMRDLLPPAPRPFQSKERAHEPPVPLRRPVPPPPPEDGARVGVDMDQAGRLKVTTYLIRKGHMASVDRQGYRVDGRHLDRWEALDLVNEHRRRADLPELKLEEIA